MGSLNIFKLVRRLTIRAKLLGVVLITVGAAGFFGYYAFKELSLVSASYGVLQESYQQLGNFLKIEQDTNKLSQVVNAYVITADMSWQTAYDTTSLELDSYIEQAKNQAEDDPHETEIITSYDSITSRLKGTELLILSYTQAGQSQKARSLFDLSYTGQQIEANSVIVQLVNNENTYLASKIALNKQQTKSIQGRLLLILLSLSGTVLVLLALLIGGLVNAIKRLIDGTQQFSQGNLGYRVRIQTSDELGQLASSFNRMAEKVGEGIILTKKEKDKLATVLESIGDGVFVLDEQQRILIVNETTEQISGFSRDELVGQHYFEKLKFVFEKDHTENIAFIDRVYREGIKTDMTNHTLLLTKGGGQVSVADSAAPLKNESGVVIGVVVVFRDVSEERKVERMKDEFISLASHQLRTPLTAAKWVSARLLKPKTGPLNEEQSEMVQDIQESMDRLIVLVNDLLDISRIESGRIEVEPTQLNVTSLVESVTKELASLFEQKDQSLGLEMGSNIPEITSDPKLVRQVILNLLTNASKYTPEKGKVTVGMEAGEGSIILRVSDTGVGIPLNQQEHIYERFFRASNVTQDGNEGTGLGLYLVKQVTDLLGGQVRFESAEGKGTTFWVTLPSSSCQSKT